MSHRRPYLNAYTHEGDLTYLLQAQPDTCGSQPITIRATTVASSPFLQCPYYRANPRLSRPTFPLHHLHHHGLTCDIESSKESRLFSLPRKVRKDIYRRVLVVAHPLYLFTEGTSHKIELFAPERPVRWLALLYANRQLYAEASATLYGSHQFVLVDTTRSQANLLQSFLDLIGSVNAGHLSHMCINFPVAESVGCEAGEVTLREDDLRGLKLLQMKCCNLTTLKTFVHSQNSRDLVMASHDSKNSQCVRETLSQVDAQLKAIRSLCRILVRLYDGPLAPEVTELMQSFGWDVSPGP